MASPVISAIMSKMHPADSDHSPSGSESAGPSTDEGLLSCAEDLLAGVKTNDPQATAAALKAVFEYLENQPHSEAGEAEE